MKNLVNYLDDYFDENYEDQISIKKIKNKKINISKEKNIDECIKNKKTKKNKHKYNNIK